MSVGQLEEMANLDPQLIATVVKVELLPEIFKSLQDSF
jgi:hypothetical protein